MWKTENLIQFKCCIFQLIEQDDVQKMGGIKQHVKEVTCLDHCVFVAYLSFLICRKFNMNYKAAARAALIHDMHLRDWKKLKVGPIKRLTIHPVIALQNAQIYNISELEEDIILKHMWPISISRFPKYRESVVVSLADKICAIAEFSRIYHIMGIGKKLNVEKICSY